MYIQAQVVCMNLTFNKTSIFQQILLTEITNVSQQQVNSILGSS